MNVTDDPWYQKVLKASEAVVIARANLAAAEMEFHRLVGERRGKSPAPSPVSKNSTRSATTSGAGEAEPVAQRVKRVLASGKKVSFGELFKGVLSGGPATKFAVRSALSKARAKGVVKFSDGAYSMPAPRGQKKTPVPPTE